MNFGNFLNRTLPFFTTFPGEVAFGYQPKLTANVELLISLLQFLSVLLKSESSNVWDCLENTNYPIFSA